MPLTRALMLRAKPPVKNDGSEKNICLTEIISEIKRAAQPTVILRLCSFEFVFWEKIFVTCIYCYASFLSFLCRFFCAVESISLIQVS